MELDKVKVVSFRIIGWFSVITGVLALLLLNISMLSGYDISFMEQLSFWVSAILISGLVSLFGRHSRPLGLWGIGIALFLIFFTGVIFFLGWMIVPFP
ncbi:hypothetical protein [Bhargavaea beijingensis]|uniref:DUF4064 domain-containing protein n=1 Tax=Bhargavaea beijingensis TaxID=426756 RepID=A0A1G7GZ90_9BACL|nr:hypothetical protein [Bhargavaea beijingensis]SDE93425.1 hypothetical protein SAMN04488126_13113 [Bhargavaea beijingensis]